MARAASSLPVPLSPTQEYGGLAARHRRDLLEHRLHRV